MNKERVYINFDNFGTGKFKFLPPDAYVIQHPFILSNSKILQNGHTFLIIYSGVVDPVIKAVRLLDAWNEQNICWLEVFDIENNKTIFYSQDLDSYEYDFLIISMLFLDDCVRLANKKGGTILI
jgi:hypothetical protein